MTAILAALKVVGPFLKASWPYLLCAIVAGYLTHRWDSGSYARLSAEFAGYKAQVAQADDTAQKAAKEALQAQIQKRLDTEAHNAQVIQQLQSERDNAAADRDFARRLLTAAQAKPSPRGDPVSPAGGRQPVDDSTGSPSDRSLVADLGDAAGECRDAIQRLAALQAELQPQLR